MKKLLLMSLKYLNSYTNNEITPREEAEQIMKYLLLKSSTARSLEVYASLESLMDQEMQQRAFEAQNTLSLIRLKWKTKRDYTAFDKPLSEIETEYEIIKPN